MSQTGSSRQAQYVTPLTQQHEYQLSRQIKSVNRGSFACLWRPISARTVCVYLTNLSVTQTVKIEVIRRAFIIKVDHDNQAVVDLLRVQCTVYQADNT